MDSQDILRRAVDEAHKRGYCVGNVDIALIAEEPKIAPHLDEMKAVLSASLQIAPEEVGLKATTNEKIGDLGRCAGIAAHAVCMLMRKES
ncbi:hypothetical protein GCM10007047_09510 [Cerasicoccus arenae]|uniref:2-C-methyl-D-erythritol 2,4-cyclodiphosphate synthase domain-containing protein n=2 Tax=Cerasicoccus arenae TaxID=424488 RepID=A0A8J3DFN0_9BACT|nr:hypothetical protein GCM10007047_09510 [Cerasicoccus arenae]